jgi:hypothetical protein
LLEELKETYDTVYDIESVDSPVKGLKLMAHDGRMDAENKEDMPQGHSPIVKIYLVDNTDGGTFVITLKYFIEAEEGHGSRMDAMLREFTVVPKE